MLIDRQVKIIKLILRYRYGINGESLAKRLGVSNRTIRSDISKLNVILVDFKCSISSSRKKGYFLTNDDFRIIKTVIKSIDSKAFNEIPSLPEERIYFFVGRLISDVKINIYDLADEVFVSIQTIYKDFGKIKEIFNNILLVDKVIISSEFVFIDDVSEVELRKILFFLVKEDICKNNNILNNSLYYLFKHSLDEEELIFIEKKLRYLLKSENFIMTEQNIILSVWLLNISCIRSYCGAEVDNYESLNEDTDLKNLINEFVKENNICLGKYDVLMLVDYMSSIIAKKVIDFDLSVEKKLLYKFLDSVIKKYNVEIFLTNELEVEILNYIRLLIKRMKVNYNLENPFMEEIQKSFKHSYDMTAEWVYILNEELNLKINNGELAYLTLYTELIVKIKLRKKNIVIVSGVNNSLTFFLKNWLQDIFKERITILDCIPSSQLIDYLNINIVDIIITMVNIGENINIPIVNIYSLPKEKDKLFVEKALIEKFN